MPISEKEVSTNTSDSVGINIYSLGSETQHVLIYCRAWSQSYASAN